MNEWIKDIRTEVRATAIGFGTTEIKPGESKEIETWPQPLLFKAKMLIVPRDIAGDFEIEHLIFGQMSQFEPDATGASTGPGPGSRPAPVPATFCDPENYRFPHRMRTIIRLGHRVVLQVKNTGSSKRTFVASLFGDGEFECWPHD